MHNARHAIIPAAISSIFLDLCIQKALRKAIILRRAIIYAFMCHERPLKIESETYSLYSGHLFGKLFYRKAVHVYNKILLLTTVKKRIL